MTTDQHMRALADGATDGPWIDYDRGIGHEIHRLGTNDDGHQYEVELNNRHRETFSPEDATFIAACREWVPDALERMSAIRQIANNLIGENAGIDGNEALCRIGDALNNALDGNNPPTPDYRALYFDLMRQHEKQALDGDE